MTDLDKRNLIQKTWAHAGCPTVHRTRRIALPLEAPCTPLSQDAIPTNEPMLAVTYTKYSEQVGPLWRWVIDGDLNGVTDRVFQGPLGVRV